MPGGADAADDRAESLCVRCARRGMTCCQGSGVFLTRGDLDRIAGSVGHRDFYEYNRIERDDCPADDILWADAARDGGIRTLRHKSGGAGNGAADCLFLGDEGCVLAKEIRPLICRLYPFEYDHETIRGVTPHLCPVPERDNHPFLLAALGMNREQAEEWRQILYAEVAREFHP